MSYFSKGGGLKVGGPSADSPFEVRWISLAACVLAGGLSAQEESRPTDWRFAPPDASLFLGVEVRRISGEFESWLRQADARVDRTDLKSLQRLERVTLALAIRGGATPVGVALLEGPFSEADLGPWRKAAATGSSLVVAYLGPGRALIGDESEVRAAKVRLTATTATAAGPRTPSDGLAEVLAAAAPALRRGDFWVIGSMPRDLGPLLKASLLAQSVRSGAPGASTAKSPDPPVPRKIKVWGQPSGPVELTLPD